MICKLIQVQDTQCSKNEKRNAMTNVCASVNAKINIFRKKILPSSGSELSGLAASFKKISNKLIFAHEINSTVRLSQIAFFFGI